MIYKPGDFILTHGTAFYSKGIEREQKRRYPGHPEWTHWTHAALIINEQGDLLQALGNGIVGGNVADYPDHKVYDISQVAPTDEDRARVVRFALSQKGIPYDWIDIASILISLTLHIKLSFEVEGHYICSGFVARCLERTLAIFPRTAEHMMPADHAAYFS